MSTGLTVEELAAVERPQKLVLAEWHVSKAGWNEGRLWLPRRIRAMTRDERLRLANDPQLDLIWEAREIRRVKRSVHYFVANYGSIEPEEGPPIPFDLWPEQEEVLADFEKHLRNIVLKGRQLGLTWLAVHYALWLMAHNPATPNAKILALSKKGSDAEVLLDRTRRVNDRLPAFLSADESFRTRESNNRFRLRDRGSEMRSLMGTPEASSGFTATLAIVDEFSKYPNQKAQPTWTSLLPTLGERGRVVVIFTGNGRTGNGAAASMLWDRAISQDSELHPIFLPYDVYPERRRPGWRAEKEKEFLSVEEAHAEYPANEEEALAGAGSFHVYPHDGIAAALRIGRQMERLAEQLAEGEGIEWGIDWGDFQTVALYALPLARGGLYVIDELFLSHVEPGQAAEQIVYRHPAGILGPRFVASYADSNPLGTNKTFARVLREAHDAHPQRYPRQHVPVAFSKFKEGGGERAGVNTVAYLVHLLNAAARFTGEPDEAEGLLAVHPRCLTLAAQLRNLERDADTGKVRKPALDPRHVERGDHGPDALVALGANRAARWRAEVA